MYFFFYKTCTHCHCIYSLVAIEGCFPMYLPFISPPCAVCFFFCLFGRDLFFPAFSLDSSQTNVASGSHAEVKAALLWVNGSAFSCLQYPITV